MNWSGKRTIVACLLTAALGLMLCPPWLGVYHHGHRLLWNGRGSPDWSRLTLEFCLVAVIGVLALVVAPMVGHPSASTLKVWLHRAGLVLGCAAALILATTASYDWLVRFSLLRDYNRKVQEFQAKAPLLQEAFPLELSDDPYGPYGGIVVNSISNVHEAELMLRSLGCDDRGIQRAMALFLSASTPEDPNKNLTFEVGTTGEKPGGCVPKEDIFDQVGANTAPPLQAPAPPPGFTVDVPIEKDFEKWRAAGKNPSQKVKWDDEAKPESPPPRFTPVKPAAPTPSDESYWTKEPAAPKQHASALKRHGKFSAADIDLSAGLVPKYREIVFAFRIENADAAKRFFAPLPDWHTEALQRKIEVSRVPDWMKPGELPASWSFTEWLDSRSSWLIPAAVLLALSALCFVTASRFKRAGKDSVGSAR
jgi:hypothetical protein